MAIERWDPLGDMISLRDAMDRLLQESFIRPSGMLTGGRSNLPLDVVDNDENFVIYTWLPGVKPEDVQITVQGDTLTIRGETREPEAQRQATAGQQSQQGQPTAQTMPGTQGQDRVQGQGQGSRGNWIMRERRHGTFYRSVVLPTPVNADKATTQFEHGELIITLPKAEEAKPKQIRINAGPSRSGQLPGGQPTGTQTQGS